MLNDVIAVTNRKLSQRPFLEQIKRVCQLRPEAIISREKDLSETEYAKLAEEVYNITTSYITAGHVYVTDCKKGLAPRGLDFLKNVCVSVDIPVYAIGGINIDDGRREEVKKYGAAGSCIMSGMMKV